MANDPGEQVVAVFAILGGRSATSRTPAPERARAPSGRMP
jgi:hypothetical protein